MPGHGAWSLTFQTIQVHRLRCSRSLQHPVIPGDTWHYGTGVLTSAWQDPELDLAESSSHHVRRGAGEGSLPKLASPIMAPSAAL